MYNGIGLQTPRGSGTNGHVQRNWAVVRKTKDRVNYRTEEEIAQLDSTTNKQPNKDILDHERKRKIEVKCAELEDVLEQQGYSRSDVEEKIAAYRATLMDGDTLEKQTKDDFGRLIVRETHQLAEAQQEKNARLREAFGISSHFVEGSSLQGGRRSALAPPLPAVSPPTLAISAPDKKKRRQSSSPEMRKDKKKKSKKNKKDRSASSAKKDKKKKRSHSSDDSSSSSSSQDGDSDSASDSSHSDRQRRKRKKKRASKQKQSSDSSRNSSPVEIPKKKSRKDRFDDTFELTNSNAKNYEKDSHDKGKKNKNEKYGKIDKEFSSNSKKSLADESETKLSKADKSERNSDLKEDRHDKRKPAHIQKSPSRERNDSKKPSESRRRSRSPTETSHRRSRTPKRKPADNSSTDRNKRDYHQPRSSHAKNDRDNSYSRGRRENVSRSPVHSRNDPDKRHNRRGSVSPRPDRDKNNSKKSQRYDSRSPKRQKKSHSPRRDRSRSSSFKQKERYKSPPRKRDRDNRSPKHSHRERSSKSPKSWKREAENRTHSRRLSAERHRPVSPKRSASVDRKKSPKRARSPSPREKKHADKHSTIRDVSPPKKNKVTLQSTVQSVTNQDRKKNDADKPSRTPDNSPPRKSTVSDEADKPPKDDPKTEIKNDDIPIVKETSDRCERIEILMHCNIPTPNECIMVKQISFESTIIDGSLNEKSQEASKDNVLPAASEESKLPKVIDDVVLPLNDIAVPSHSKNGLSTVSTEDKRSPSAGSKSSSSLSYSPARRSPERYIDILDKLSEKDKSKYIQPTNQPSKSKKGSGKKDSKEPSGNDRKQKSVRAVPQPVVRLRASSSEDEDYPDDSETLKIEDDDDREIKQLDLLKIGLAAIAKESVEKKRLQQKARDEGNITFPILPSASTAGVSDVPRSMLPSVLDRNGSASSESMDISPENKTVPKLDIIEREDADDMVQEIAVEKSESFPTEANRRRLQTPDKKRSSSRSRSRSRSSSSSSSASSRRWKGKYSSGSSRGSSRERSQKSPADRKRKSPSERKRPSRSSTASSSSSSDSSRSSRSSRSGSASSRSESGSRSRSPSIPRRIGSPSFLDRRRITSARKRPIPYRRPTPSSHSSSSAWSSRPSSPHSLSPSPAHTLSPIRSPVSPPHTSPYN